MGNEIRLSNLDESLGPINRLTIEPPKFNIFDNIKGEKFKGLLTGLLEKKKMLDLIKYNKAMQT